MERRQFLSTTLGASLLASAAAEGFSPSGGRGENASGAPDQEKPSVPAASPSYYVWLEYTLRNGPQQKRMADFLGNALVPALNRLGSTPVGVFEAMVGDPGPMLSVIIPFASLDQMVAHEAALERDQDFVRAAGLYLDSPATDASYVRRETSLLHAFPNVPKIEVPAATATKGPRLLELRRYESHGELAQRKKMSMFTEMGEMEIFRKTGLTPVFFARTLIGQRQPNFVYMLVHDNLAAREKNWDNFRTSPEWKKLSSTPGFADAEILTNITTTFLRPTAYSQI
jgi:hypothetical protein